LIQVTDTDVISVHSIPHSDLHICMSPCDTTVSVSLYVTHSGQQSLLQSELNRKCMAG